MTAPTRIQSAVLAAIRDYTTTHGYPPSVRDIADSVGLVPSTVQHALARRGFIRRDGSRSRALVLTDPTTEAS